MRYPGDKLFFIRLTRVLRRQEAVVGRLQRLDGKGRRAIARLVVELRGLQRSMWGSLATRPRRPLLTAARQVDTLADQWSQVAKELQIAPISTSGEAASPLDG